MDQLLVLFVGIVVFVTALAGITIWSPRRMSVKVSALALSALLMASSYGGFLELMGRPKPASLEWLSQVEEATVVAVRMREGEAIYLWLELETPSEPRSYVIPWNAEEARQLQDAMREAESNGGEVRMREPFSDRPQTDQPMFYAQPQAIPPPKPTAG
ncbi:MAG: hypothetical protein IID55_01225 [Proteobacteria bacterium]|nr:hypothetical protein [Pseudomonadota bacterium]